MIDVRRLRTDIDAVKAALARKRVDPSEVERAAALDEKARAASDKRDAIRARRNQLSNEVGAAMRDGDTARAERIKADSSSLANEAARIDAEASNLQAALRDMLLRLPNLPSEDAPDGASEDDNVVVRTVGFDPASYGEHQRVPHWDSGPALGILDNERAVKVSGSMFSMPRGLGATLSRALCQLALDRNADAYEEVRPPSFVTSSTLTATGQLPKFADEAYHIERDDLWAVPTAEVPLTSLARDEVLLEADLPVRLMAYSPCYRREAGAAGRDTRGMLRSHEFDKVELLALATPAQAPAMLDEILERAVGTIAALDLAYRVVDICTGDLGQSHHRQFDLQVYCPGGDTWQEVSSVSWFTDYQARRANIRYRPDAANRGTEFVHTLNGSALAVPRVWAAIVETYRQPDGSIAIPDALQRYMRGATVIPAK